MTVTLAATWQPRGEMARFVRLRPQLAQVYEQLVIAVPIHVNPTIVEQVRALTDDAPFTIVSSPQPAWSRYLALQSACHASAATHVHYADMDRLLRWVETQPEEWRQTVETVKKSDCLIIGRTANALETHPQALQQTEQIINTLFSHLFDQTVDLGGGSRGYSRQAVEHLLAHSTPGPWDDAQWPMLLHQAGFRLNYQAVDGLDWESADRHRAYAADAELQRTLAAAYDADPKHWARRVQIALEIIQAGLAVTEEKNK